MADAPAPRTRPERSEHTVGLLCGLGTYLMWALFPIYFHALAPSGVWEILGARITFTAVFCALVLTVTRRWGWVPGLLSDRRTLLILGVAGYAVALNWGVYISAVEAGNVTEAALGYFINPLVTVALGVVFLKERLRWLQWVAVGIGALAVAYLTWDYGRAPYVALTLAFSFGFYGLLKNRVGGRVEALPALTVESVALLPVSVGLLLWVGLTGRSTFVGHGPVHFVLLALAGVVTALPLITFGAAASRVPLSTIGLLQYITPVGQLMVAVFIFGEHMALSRWIGFGIVWVALVVMTTDQLANVRVARRRAGSARERGRAGTPAGSDGAPIEAEAVPIEAEGMLGAQASPGPSTRSM